MKPNKSINLFCSLFLIYAFTSYTEAKAEILNGSIALDQKIETLVNEVSFDIQKKHFFESQFSQAKMIINLSKLAQISHRHLTADTSATKNNQFKGSVCTPTADNYPNLLFKSSLINNSFYKKMFASEFELITFSPLTYNNKSYDGVFVKLISKGDDDTVNTKSVQPGETGYTFFSFIACDPTTSYKIIKDSAKKAIIAIKQGQKNKARELVMRIVFAFQNVYVKNTVDKTSDVKLGCVYDETYDSFVYSDTSANVNSAVAIYGARLAPIAYVNVFDSNGIQEGVQMQVLSNNAQDLLLNTPIAQTNQIVYGYKRFLNCNR